MIDVTFTIGALDLSGLLSTYNVQHETEYSAVITTMNGTEHGFATLRPIVTFSLIPLREDQCAELYEELSKSDLEVQYTNPLLNQTATGVMRLTTSTDAIFGLSSVDGHRYYKGSQITLRQRTVM